MDFEKVLPIIVFIVWAIIANAAKKKKGQRQSSVQDKNKPKQRGFSLRDLQSGVEKVLKELEQPVRTKKAAVSKKVAKRKEQAKKRQTSIEQRQSELPVESAKIDISKLDTHSHDSSKEKTMVTKSRTERFEGLKKAVVWSEILAKPLSLRKK